MTLQEQQAAFAVDVAHLILNIQQYGWSVTFAEAYRTPEQAELNAKSGKGIKDSLHIQRLAVDLNLFDSSGHYKTDKESYERFGNYWESLNPRNRWGGRFETLVDSNHFERRPL